MFALPYAQHSIQVLSEENACRYSVRIDRATESFTQHTDSAKPTVFLAGGIGITPFLSIVRQAEHEWLPLELYPSYSNRQPQHTLFLEFLRMTETSNPNF